MSLLHEVLLRLYLKPTEKAREAGCLPSMKAPPIDTAHKRWYGFIAFFCISFFAANGNAVELLESIDEGVSTGAFLVRLAIESDPSVVLALIGQDSGQYQSAQAGRPLVQHH